MRAGRPFARVARVPDQAQTVANSLDFHLAAGDPGGRDGTHISARHFASCGRYILDRSVAPGRAIGNRMSLYFKSDTRVFSATSAHPRDLAKSMNERHQADVLIIGSGAAGLAAALQLADRARVIVLSKDRIDGGSTNRAQGGIAAVTGPGDSPEAHIRDTRARGRGTLR